MHLEFEKPIADLEAKIEEMKSLAQNSGVNVDKAVSSLEIKLDSLKKEIFQNLTSWQRVQLARHPDRPYTIDYIYEITDDFIELHGDRRAGDDPAMVAGFGFYKKRTVAFIGHQKGRTTRMRIARNFGQPNPEGYRKALRVMKLAEKLKLR